MPTALALIVFAITWLIWSGYAKPQLLLLGAAACLLVTLLARRIGFFAADAYVLHLSCGLPRFWGWLAGEIVRSNLRVAYQVLRPRLAIDPSTIVVDASALPPVGQALLANTITITPGTLAIDANHGRIVVHCLTRHDAAELRKGIAARRVAALLER